MRSILTTSILLIYLAGLNYLTLPTPPLPDLDRSTQSDEPGDTWQHPDQKAFYTGRNIRSEILGELQQKFSLSDKLAGLFEYRLNYRPEEVGELVRDQLRSYYLEEVVHPLRESLFINVFEPEKAPMIENDKKNQERMFFKGVYYPVKVTLRPVSSNTVERVLIWTLIFPASYLVVLSLKKSLDEN